MLQSWRKFPVSLGELSLPTVLRCGQSFRWKNVDDEWSCALYGRIISLKQDSTDLHYRAIYPNSEPATDDTAEVLRDYFNLSVDLTKLYELWSERDPVFKKKAPKFTGVRILRQDPWENLISFICSTNNNILRIRQMVEKLCTHYGPKLGDLEGVPYHDFPTPENLAVPGVEQNLRELGFGYRAKYIATTAGIIAHGKSPGWLSNLRNVPYKEAHEELLSLPGVGPKVADCVCLMSMDKSEAVPVDTHVWQIAVRDYHFGKGKIKTLTPAAYWAIGDYFREIWGKEAGWAHSVLFTADLRAFADRMEPTTKAAKKVTVKKIVKKETEVLETTTVSRKRKKPIDASPEDTQMNTKLEVKEENEVINTAGLRRSGRVRK
ncbi:8-oxoguanine DNA glycosylase [Peziza echinospora]|nr:8-oxoguanine DNA glycosylase [Peziza echinospora]